MDVRLINPFIASTVRVFDMMLGMQVKTGKPSVSIQRPPMRECVTATIHMRGGAQGAVILQFSREAVFAFSSAFGMDSSSFSDAVDAVGEFANMVTGAAKSELGTDLIEISVPKIYIDEESSDRTARLKPWLCVPFSGETCSFHLAVSIHGPRSSELGSMSGEMVLI